MSPPRSNPITMARQSLASTKRFCAAFRKVWRDIKARTAPVRKTRWILAGALGFDDAAFLTPSGPKTVWC